MKHLFLTHLEKYHTPYFHQVYSSESQLAKSILTFLYKQNTSQSTLENLCYILTPTIYVNFKKGLVCFWMETPGDHIEFRMPAS